MKKSKIFDFFRKNLKNHEKSKKFKKSKIFRILFGKFQKCSATQKSNGERQADATLTKSTFQYLIFSDQKNGGIYDVRVASSTTSVDGDRATYNMKDRSESQRKPVGAEAQAHCPAMLGRPWQVRRFPLGEEAGRLRGRLQYIFLTIFTTFFIRVS